MKSITLQISEEELREVTQAYKTLQNFLEKIISPNELYIEDFYDGLTAKKRENEPRESLKSVKKSIVKAQKDDIPILAMREAIKDKLFLDDLIETSKDFRE